MAVNVELCKLYDCLTSNKLILNIRKSNFVIFHPYQKRPNLIDLIHVYSIMRKMKMLLLNLCKDHIKYLGILIDENLTWKHHVHAVSTKSQ